MMHATLNDSGRAGTKSWAKGSSEYCCRLSEAVKQSSGKNVGVSGLHGDSSSGLLRGTKANSRVFDVIELACLSAKLEAACRCISLM